MSNPLHKRILSSTTGDPARDLAMRVFWAKNTFVVSTFEGDLKGMSAVTKWCIFRWGPPADPFIGTPGVWLRGLATVNGWTWYGFDTEEHMNKFKEQFDTEDE